MAMQTKEDVISHMQVYELRYIEREPGIDDYPLTIYVSDDMLRIDEAGEDSGYILYDDEKKIIYSVSHFDRSILVIEEYEFDVTQSPAEYKTEYFELSDAPKINGNKIFNYRVFTTVDNNEETCMDIQLAEGLLPSVRKMFKNYHQVVTGQQVKMTDNTLSEVQSACYYIDQIYNTAAYYDKGLPIREWHSNGRFKVLQSYNKVVVDKNLFSIPEDYHHFSISNSSKTFIN